MLKFLLFAYFPLFLLLPYSRKNRDMVLVKGGSFKMQDKIPVSISDFYLCKYELTMAEYDSFCAYEGRVSPKDKGWGRARRPAIHVSWHNAIEYCNWRSQHEGLTPCYSIEEQNDTVWKVDCNWSANGYRLPTEIEWEYAAKGGNKSKGYTYSGSNSIGDVVWHESNSDGKTQTVGTKKTNELGLYDMSGNVWEWCWHWHGEDTEGDARILRGGAWSTNAFNSKVLTRIYGSPDKGQDDCGFRLARSVHK